MQLAPNSDLAVHIVEQLDRILATRNSVDSSVTLPAGRTLNAACSTANSDAHRWYDIFARRMLNTTLGALAGKRIARIQNEINSRLSERIRERDRIARELHDTLFQGFQGVILRIAADVRRLSPSDPVRLSIERTLDLADETLNESRHRVRKLRDSGWDDEMLVHKLDALAEELRPSFRGCILMEDDGTSIDMNHVVRDELFLIFREALLNAAHHSRATQIICRMTHDSHWMRISCRDNGCGISPQILSTHRTSHHLGLIGMQERSTLIGGKFALKSDSEHGTEVIVRLSAQIAYAHARNF